MSTPKILYTLVAYNGVVLVDYSKSKGDFINETRDYVFPKLKDKGSCLLYTSPSPRDLSTSRMPSSA